MTADGILISPNFPNKYPNNIQKERKTIRGGPGTVLVIEFLKFKIEQSAKCRPDYLQIIDGDGQALTEKMCGNSKPVKITSRTNTAHIEFKTNRKGRQMGWKLKWMENPNA